MNPTRFVAGTVVLLTTICVTMTLLALAATSTLREATQSAAAALDSDTTTEQSGRAVCVAGRANLRSCNVQQSQEIAPTPAPAPAQAAAWGDYASAWLGLLVLGIVVILLVGVIASMLGLGGGH